MQKAYLVPHPPLIVPGVGAGDEIPDTRRAYEWAAADAAAAKPETAVVISPHSVLYGDYIHISPGKSAKGDFGAFRAGHIKFSVAYDEALAARIAECAEADGIPAGPLGERDKALDHGVTVPLYFFKSPRIVRISLSGLSLLEHYRFGMCIRRAALSLSRGIVLIASGDMSHKLKADGPYGFVKEGPAHDAFVRECARDADFRRLLSIDPALCERAAECGLRSFVVLAGFLDGLRVKSRAPVYEGPFGVGYLTAAFTGDGEADSLLPSILSDVKARAEKRRDGEDSFVRLARRNVEAHVRTGKSVDPPADADPALLSRRAGVFVSIKKDGNLRGCIGTILPTERNIALEILANSLSAATRDPRFDPIGPEELDALSYSVDVLSPPEPIQSARELDASRYGVIVTRGHRRGLLLPNLDGVDSVEAQISIALQKAGIRADEPYTLERFEVVRHT
ncbi:MAG: AmmeMemoRadiSam system protein A [Clostridiales Family XIII bacterium]|jgi:AmmeMemoRadiSam system protein A|nr:AmmeMemoRadiSam system protein A [Clostridiales Family XIII bacterium]